MQLFPWFEFRVGKTVWPNGRLDHVQQDRPLIERYAWLQLGRLLIRVTWHSGSWY